MHARSEIILLDCEREILPPFFPREGPFAANEINSLRGGQRALALYWRSLSRNFGNF